jgi:hypothetical protein
MSSDSVPVLVGALRSGWPASEKVNIFAKSTLYSALSYKMDKLQKSIDTDWRDAVISDYRALAALGALKEIDPATLVPEKITGNFDASQNYATNFGGTEYLFPKEIDGNLTISADIAKLTKFFPNRVTGDVVVIIGTGYINAKSLNLPIQNIGGSLILRGAVNNFIAMPKNIGKDLDLSGLSATTPIPVGINIGGSILISKPNMQNADMIIGDAQSKGYRVTVSEVPAGFAPGPCGSEENPCPRPSF